MNFVLKDLRLDESLSFDKQMEELASKRADISKLEELKNISSLSDEQILTILGSFYTLEDLDPSSLCAKFFGVSKPLTCTVPLNINGKVIHLNIYYRAKKDIKNGFNSLDELTALIKAKKVVVRNIWGLDNLDQNGVRVYPNSLSPAITELMNNIVLENHPLDLQNPRVYAGLVVDLARNTITLEKIGEDITSYIEHLRRVTNDLKIRLIVHTHKLLNEASYLESYYLALNSTTMFDELQEKNR